MSRRSIRQSEIATLESGLSLISGSLTSVHANCPKLSQLMERPVISGFERCGGERERSVSRCDALSSSPECLPRGKVTQAGTVRRCTREQDWPLS
jgi:hypothetical protein